MGRMPMPRKGTDAMRLTICLGFFFALVLTGCSGCSGTQDLKPADFSGRTPIVRVLIIQGATTVKLTATRPPVVTTSTVPSPHRLDVAAPSPAPLTLTPVGWRLGNVIVGTGEMHIE